MRIAFAGSSGTGKTTLSTFLASEYQLPMNPVGSRSVAKAMGFERPYDVDKAGKRAEFQRRLVTEKRAWEDAHEAFVVDRTTMDNLAYTMLHDVYAVDEAFLEDSIAGMKRYTHVVYCPVSAFCNTANDPSRVDGLAYHRVFDIVLSGLVLKYLPRDIRYGELHTNVLEERQSWLRDLLGRAK